MPFTVKQIKAFTLTTRIVDSISNEVGPTSGGGLVQPDSQYLTWVSVITLNRISTNPDPNPD